MNSSEKSKNTYSVGFLGSVSAALEGVVHALKEERNMRIHFMAGFLVLIAGIYFDLSSVEFLLLLFAITFVLVSEMINTAIEYSIDFVSEEYHPKVKIIKDIAAGAVFVSAVNAVISGYILFAKKIDFKLAGSITGIKQSPWHITLITILVVIGLVLMVKILRREEHLLRGGLPSGHSAFAFLVWMLVTLFTENILVSILVFILAVTVARSRLSAGIHTLREIVIGSLLGALAALLIVQILS